MDNIIIIFSYLTKLYILIFKQIKTHIEIRYKIFTNGENTYHCYSDCDLPTRKACSWKKKKMVRISQLTIVPVSAIWYTRLFIVSCRGIVFGVFGHHFPVRKIPQHVFFFPRTCPSVVMYYLSLFSRERIYILVFFFFFFLGSRLFIIIIVIANLMSKPNRWLRRRYFSIIALRYSYARCFSRKQ